MTKCVKAYGGPLHGHICKVGDHDRFKAFLPTPWLAMEFPDAETLERFCDDPYGACTYYVCRFADTKMRPDRSREIRVAVYENAPLTPKEKREIEGDLRKRPWEVYQSSIVHDFEQWFAACLYRRTGLLMWKGRPVRY